MTMFSRQLANFANRTQEKADRVLAKSSLVILSRVIQRSPVDTGRFRGNWQTGISERPEGELDTLDKTGTTTLAEGESTLLGARLGEDVFVVNNLPYANVLENGSSQQAPVGMVAITLAEWPGIVAGVVDSEK